MAISVVVGDITRLEVDAIVNAANELMLGGGGVDGAIHRAAGPELLEACQEVREIRPGVRCPTGEARITPGFRLPARHVIHTVGPIWKGGDTDETALLASCYASCIAVANKHDVTSVAFPAISCGVYRFPVDQAAAIAVKTLRQALAWPGSVERVLLVAFDESIGAVLRKALERV